MQAGTSAFEQKVAERAVHILDGRVCMEFFAMGLANAWGSARDDNGLSHKTGGHVPGTHYDRNRTMLDFMETDPELLELSQAKHVFEFYGAERIIWVDWTDFYSHADAHLGWHEDNLNKMMTENGGRKLKHVFHEFLTALKAKPASALQQGLAVVSCCASGRTRSLGGATILLKMCKLSYWQLLHFEVICLSKCLWSEKKCSRGGRCEQCLKAPGSLKDSFFRHSAWEDFLRAKKVVFQL